MLSLSKGQKALIRPGLFAQFLHSDDPALSAAKTFSRDYVNTPCSWAPPLYLMMFNPLFQSIQLHTMVPTFATLVY